MIKHLFFLLFFISKLALAQETDKFSQDYSIVFHGLSNHSGSYAYNEKNSGVGIRYQSTTDISYQLGVYKNSYHKITLYTIIQYTPFHLGTGIKLGGFSGIVTGYHGVSKFPIVAGLMADSKLSERFSITTRYVPKTSRKTDSVVSIEVSHLF